MFNIDTRIKLFTYYFFLIVVPLLFSVRYFLLFFMAPKAFILQLVVLVSSAAITCVVSFGLSKEFKKYVFLFPILIILCIMVQYGIAAYKEMQFHQRTLMEIMTWLFYGTESGFVFSVFELPPLVFSIFFSIAFYIKPRLSKEQS